MTEREQREEQLVLDLLDAVGRRSDISQRHLARELGVALGLANSYLKRCIRKGWVKISEAPANRYLYYLTPKGFTEKSRLTARYLSYSFSFYRQAADGCLAVFQACDKRGWKRITLGGVSDLAEIASVKATEAGVNVVAIYDPHSEHRRFAGKTVYQKHDDLPVCDAWLLTDVNAPAVMKEHLLTLVPADRLIVPKILRL